MSYRAPKIRRHDMVLPGDGLLDRWKKRLTRRPVPQFPRTLQIQTRTGCNADCVFCPYGATAGAQPRGTMEWALFRKIIDESARYGVRRISPYLMNEPLLDPEIFQKIAYVNRVNRRARVTLSTNGSLLTPDAVGKILDLDGGLHELSISIQGIEPDAYARTMRGGLDLRHTLSNVDHLVREMRRRRARRPVLWVTMIETGLIDVRAAVEHWRSRGLNVRTTRLENRGGNVRAAEDFSRGRGIVPFSGCTRLFKQAYIKFNGDVVLCCTDYESRIVLGNVRESSLHEVWNGAAAVSVRSKFLSGRMGEILLCGACKVDGERGVEFRAPRAVSAALPVERRSAWFRS